MFRLELRTLHVYCYPIPSVCLRESNLSLCYLFAAEYFFIFLMTGFSSTYYPSFFFLKVVYRIECMLDTPKSSVLDGWEFVGNKCSVNLKYCSLN
jgi:hypothetical protein